MKKKCVYCVESLIDNRKIIGSTKDFDIRHYQYLYELERGIQANPFLQDVYNKYGVSNLKFYIIEELHNENKEELLKAEDYWISELHTLERNFGFNCKTAVKQLCTNDIKKKRSIRMSGIGNHMYGVRLIGRKFSQQEKDNISKRLKGRTFTNEWKEKIKESRHSKLVNRIPNYAINEYYKLNYFSAVEPFIVGY